MTSPAPSTIDEYIAGFPVATQVRLEQMRALIRAAVPEAEESISYAIPTLKLKGAILIYFAGFKSHTSLYPAPREHEALATELATYKGGTGTVQFPLTKPLPVELVTRIVQVRLQALTEKAASKKKAPKKAAS